MMATSTIVLATPQRPMPRSSGGSSDLALRNSTATILPPVSRRKQATVLLSAFMTIVLTIGYNQTYGVFQEYYLSKFQNVLDPSPASQATPPTALLAFVGTLGAGLTWAGSILVNPLISRIEHRTWSSHSSSTQKLWRRLILRKLTPRTITISGVLLMSLGFALASFSTTIWQLLLTQGFLYGLGSSLLYFPFLSPAPEYFTTHRATAMGFILAGAGAGGLTFSPAIRVLLSTLGGRWTLRIYGLFVLVIGTPIAWSVPRSRFPSAAAASFDNNEPGNEIISSSPAPRLQSRLPRTVLLGAPFIFSAVAAFMQSGGAQLPLSFIPSYSVSLGLSASKGATLLAVSNAINACSRILTGYVGDRAGRQNTLILTIGMSMIAVFSFWLSSTQGASSALWYGFIVVYSLSAGGYYALFPATIAEVFGIRRYAAVNAFILFFRGCGTMFGSPIGGQLLGTGGDKGALVGSADYAKIVYWDGALLLGATLCITGVRFAHARGKGWSWIA